MSRLSCVIHYSHIESANSSVIAFKEETFQRLLEGKDAHEALGGDYMHKQQSESIPDIFDDQIHGYHRQCYQRYTNAIAVYKRKFSATEIPSKRPRRSGEFGPYFAPRYVYEM